MRIVVNNIFCGGIMFLKDWGKNISNYRFMKQIYYSTAGLCILAILLMFGLSSCVNKEYDMDKLNTEVTVASEGLTLPLGKTAPITMGDILSDLDQDVLQAVEGGAYALRIADKLSLGDQLPDLKTLIDIPDVSFEDSFNFSMADFDDEEFELEGQTFKESFEVGSGDLEVDVEVPSIREAINQGLGIWEYAAKADELAIDVDDMAFNAGIPFSVPTLPVYPAGEFAVPVEGVLSIQPISQNVTITMEAPEGISNIGDIKLTSTSSLTIEVSAVNSLLSSGSLVPDFSIDLGGLLSLKSVGNVIGIGSDFTLSKTNGYKASKKYYIESVNLDSKNWGSDGKFSQTNTVSVAGNASLVDPFTTKELIQNYNGNIGLSIVIKYDEVKIASFMMDIDDIELEESIELPLKIDNITLPDGVNKVEDVIFSDASSVDLSVAINNLKASGLDVNLESLKIAFPADIDVEGAVNGVVEYKNKDLIAGFSDKIHLKKMTLPAPVGGKISYNGKVSVLAKATASGRVLSTNLPKTEAADASFSMSAASDIQVADYHIDVNSMSQKLEVDPLVFHYKLDEALGDFGTISVYPEGNPVIAVKIALPQTALGLKTGSDGIIISFPEFIHFKNVPSNIIFDEKANTVTIKGAIPESINLPLEKLAVTPKFDETAGEYRVYGEVNISGSVSTDAGTISKADIDAIAKSTISLEAAIPTMKASKVALDKFEIDLEEGFDFTIFNAKDLPKELVSVSEASLDDVNAQFALSFTNLPDLGTPVNVDVKVELPSEIVLDKTDSRVNGNVLTIAGVIKNNKLDVLPVKIEAIDLSQFDFTAGNDLTGTIKVNGNVYAENPSVSIKDISGDIAVNVSAGIKDIKFSRIAGKVDYAIEGINESVKLEGLPDFLKDENFVLDFANPYILLKAKTNIGIPVAGDLAVTPVTGGVESSATAVNCSIELPYSTSAANTVDATYWLAQEKTGCPSDCIFVQANIRDLIRKIPDELKISLNANTVKSKECVVEPDADYILDVEYEFVAPLEFGEDLNIEIKDTIQGLPDGLGKVLGSNSIQLGGEIKNSLPLQLDLKVDLLDADGNIIPMESQATQTISACATDGSASVSPLDLTIKAAKNADTSRLNALQLTFKVTSPNLSGIPVKEDSFLQAELKLVLPEGITLDIKDLNN